MKVKSYKQLVTHVRREWSRSPHLRIKGSKKVYDRKQKGPQSIGDAFARSMMFNGE